MSARASELSRLSYTHAEVAAVCGVSPKTVERARNTGALKAKRRTKNGPYVYLVVDVEQWLNSLPDG